MEDSIVFSSISSLNMVKELNKKMKTMILCYKRR